MVFIAYITGGRDKYDYYTDFVGVFNNEKDAEKAVKRNLIECGKIFDFFYDIILEDKKENAFDIENKHYSILKKINNFEERYNKCNNEDQFLEEFKEDLINIDKDLDYIVGRYNDSYYGDGWNYTIDEIEIK
jgi:hypothetical protein